MGQQGHRDTYQGENDITVILLCLRCEVVARAMNWDQENLY